MSQQFKVPDSVKHDVACPLCHAVFARELMPSRVKDFVLCGPCNTAEPVKRDTPNVCPQCGKPRQSWRSDGIALVCHFCKIGIMASDPLVGKWDFLYAQGEQVHCDVCEMNGRGKVVMRFFCNSTGLKVFRCHMKACRFGFSVSAPDRVVDTSTVLFDEKGEPIMAPSVDKAIISPAQPGLLTEEPETIAADVKKAETLELDLPKQ